MAVREPADCIVKLAKTKTENLRTIHVFFRDYQISMKKCQKWNKKDVPKSCENNGTGQLTSVGIMSALSWLLIYS